MKLALLAGLIITFIGLAEAWAGSNCHTSCYSNASGTYQSCTTRCD
jgi:hypothetical protein